MCNRAIYLVRLENHENPVSISCNKPGHSNWVIFRHSSTVLPLNQRVRCACTSMYVHVNYVLYAIEGMGHIADAFILYFRCVSRVILIALLITFY
jgi:hypothetical protein